MIQLDINGVSKQYEAKRFALQDISLSLKPGIIGLVGPNGAGKTTLLTMLAALNRPTRGTVTWNGVDIYKKPKVLRAVLGFVPQSVGYYPQLSAREFLRYFGELKGVRGKLLDERVEYALELPLLHSILGAAYPGLGAQAYLIWSVWLDTVGGSFFTSNTRLPGLAAATQLFASLGPLPHPTPTQRGRIVALIRLDLPPTFLPWSFAQSRCLLVGIGIVLLGLTALLLWYRRTNSAMQKG